MQILFKGLEFAKIRENIVKKSGINDFYGTKVGKSIESQAYLF